MNNKLWLERGTQLPDLNTVERLLFAEKDWQMIRTFSGSTALVVTEKLYTRWVEKGWIGENAFVPMRSVEGAVYVFAGKHGYLLSSMQHGPYPSQPTEAHLFAITLRRARRRLKEDVSLHDALYLEQLSLILPTFTEGAAEDEKVLGTWLCGGVAVSTNQFDRLCELLSWMPVSEVERVVADAGFDAHVNRPKDAPPVRKLDENARFSMPGRPDIEKFFNENIVEVVAKEEKYRRMGFGFPGAVVLHGPPGCGKTFAVEKLAEFLGWPVFPIDSGSIGSTFIHETGMRIAAVFDKAAKAAPAIVVIDEMESFLADRETGGSHMHHMEEVAEFLRRIPEANKNRVLVFGMTNRINAIDPAILRRGRFDHIIEMKMPSEAEMFDLLRHQLKDLPVEDGLDLKPLARKLAGRSPADSAFVVREAGRLCVRRNQEKIDMRALSDAAALLPDEKKSIARKIGF